MLSLLVNPFSPYNQSPLISHFPFFFFFLSIKKGNENMWLKLICNFTNFFYTKVKVFLD